jgi:hypothetical protein
LQGNLMIVSCMQNVLMKLGLKVLEFEDVCASRVAVLHSKFSSGGVSGEFSLKIFYDAIKILFISNREAGSSS